MKNCTCCKYAVWKKTKKGRLHPSGDGECTWPAKPTVLPPCMYYVFSQWPCGGHINRREELKEHCVYYQDHK